MFVENGTVRILTCAILVKDFIYFLSLFYRPEMFDLNLKTTEVSPQ